MNNTEIQSEHNGKQIVAAISPAGAELQSLRVTQAHSTAAREFLWQGDPEVWAGRAPILFPIVGALRHKPSFYQRQQVNLNQHGFARRSDFELLHSSKDKARFQLRANKETIEVYPWHFQLDVLFQLKGQQLTVRYEITNTGDDELLFNIGSHPAFQLAADSKPGEEVHHDDYSIEFDQPESLLLHGVSDEGLLTAETTPYPLADRSINLSETIFDHDALVFRNIKSQDITLAHKTQGSILTVNTGGAPHLGLWAKPGASYVCIEPWWGHADFVDAGDQLEHKSSIQKLSAGDSFSTAMTIKLHL